MVNNHYFLVIYNKSGISYKKILELLPKTYDKNIVLVKLKHRLETISALKDGWYAIDESKAISKRAIYKCNGYITKLINKYEINKPSIYPMSNGNIQACFSLKDYILEMIFTPFNDVNIEIYKL